MGNNRCTDMGIVKRSQFAKYFSKELKIICNKDSALWIPEYECQKSKWFINVIPITALIDDKREFWDWCVINMVGQVRCYSSTGGGESDTTQEEWWGFTHLEDIVLWKLRWT